MDFHVTILGSGAAIPTGDRNPTAQLVYCKNRNILIDCAEGTQLQMRKYGVKFQKIDVILVSHLHGDHYFGLVGLLNSMQLLGRKKELFIICPLGLKSIIELQQKYGRGHFGFEIHYKELPAKFTGEVFEDEKLKITSFPLNHKIQTQGYRITEKPGLLKLNSIKAEEDKVKIEYYHRLKKGEDVLSEDGIMLYSKTYTLPALSNKSYAFCSDTTYDESICEHIKNVDLLYHEATFLEEHKERAKATKHSTALEAAKIAAKSEAKQLVLGHLSARYKDGQKHLEEAITIFKNSIIAEDGLKIDI